MSGTQKIHELVEKGRATPAQGALLIEFRRELESSRERKLRRNSPVTRVLIVLGAFVLGLLGVRSTTTSA